MDAPRRAETLARLGLLTLAATPVAAGLFRLATLAAGGAPSPSDARFFAAPVPVIVHIVGATVFSLLGAFQFSTRGRRRRPDLHRAAGAGVALSGLGVAFSGIWMALHYAIVPADHPLLHSLRLFFGAAMAGSIVGGLVALRCGRYAAHQAWMRRAYAIGLGAGTQVLLMLPAWLLFGEPSDLARALLMGAGWVLNLAAAEGLVRASRRRARPGQSSRRAGGILPAPRLDPVPGEASASAFGSAVLASLPEPRTR